MNVRFYEKVLEWTRAGKRVAVVSIVNTVGSTPRKTGAKMLVTDRMELYGTVGGGCVEADVIFAAREVLKTLRPRLIEVDIKKKNPDEIDMLCGGEISFYVEPVMPDMTLLICGGGHISKAIAHVCQGLDFRIVVVDDRPQFANQARFPTADETICCDYTNLAEKVQLTGTTFAVTVTRGHSGDEVCLRSLLASPAPYVAMIGSSSKWANLRSNLLGAGYTKEQLERVITPAGLDIGSVTPEEIAVSVAAQIIQKRAEWRTAGFPEVGEGGGAETVERLPPADAGK
ncbi:MAG: XdhC family protein [Candidatus Sumerlaeia bacterium]|nr:XdhC family protein [Candidatus Sumerlaeia bacterium]